MAAELAPLPGAAATDILDALATAVLLLDREQRVEYLNAAAETLLGVGHNQAIGRRLGELCRGSDVLSALFEHAADGGEGVIQRELSWPTSSGEERILDCAMRQVLLGSTPQFLLELEDITQHRRVTRETALLTQLGGSRLMVRQLAHEIKNPLGGLRGAAQLLERELLDPALREYTRIIISEADRLVSLLDSMLGPGRPPAKQLINIHEITDRVYQLLRGEASAQVTVARDYDPSLPPLTVDPNHIIQAMLNLGRNALQSLGSASVAAPSLTIRTRAFTNVSIGVLRHRVVAAVQFADNGAGVPEDIRDTLFYPLVSGRADGTGLGLAIAQQLVSRHGGLIEFDSTPGRTIFTLLLPLDECKAAAGLVGR
jgi:two-component system, NtrC family, nitrogen regulation sensor histidine kinase GlnL